MGNLPRTLFQRAIARSRQQPSQPAELATKLATSLLLTAALTSCHQPLTQNHNRQKSGRTVKNQEYTEPNSNAQVNAAMLPSMSKYIREKEQNRLNRSAAFELSPLTANQHCFHKTGTNSWLSIHLTLNDQQQITGESTGALTHPKRGETLYRQTFTGELTKTQAQVEVTTYIAGITETREETWQVSATGLDTGQVAIAAAPCIDVLANF
ncbi:MAG: hypothetical protein AAF810_01135 [Cyanobacteria bacterium P01_D01_bin.36]